MKIGFNPINNKMGCASGKGYKDFKEQGTQNSYSIIRESQRVMIAQNIISRKFRVKNLHTILEIDSVLEHSGIQELNNEVESEHIHKQYIY